MSTILFIAVLILAAMVFDLKSRVNDLEKRSQSNFVNKKPVAQKSVPQQPVPLTMSDLIKDQPPVASEQPDVQPSSEPISEHHEDVEPAPIPAASPKVRAEKMAKAPLPPAEPGFSLIDWFKEDFLIKIGAILLFVGVGWFVSYAFIEGWVSPSLRIISGLLAGGAIYYVSNWRFKNDRTQGLVLNALGTGVVLVTVYSGRLLFDLFWLTGLSATLIMLLSISYTVFTGIRRDSESITLAAAASGLVVPFIAQMDEPSTFGFFSYLLLLTVSFTWVVYQTGWSRIILLLLVGTEYFLLLKYSVSIGTEEGTILLFAGLFALIFYAVGLMSTLSRSSLVAVDVSIVAINAATLWFWIYRLVPEPAQTIVCFLVAVVAWVSTLLIFREEKSPQVALLHGSLGILFVLVGTAFLFDGFSLAMAFTLEISFMVFFALQYGFKDQFLHALVGLYVLPALWVLQLFAADAWNDGWFHPEALAAWLFVICSVVLCVKALFTGRNITANIFATFAWLFAFITIAQSIDVMAAGTDLETIIDSKVFGLLSLVTILLTLKFKVTHYIRRLALFWFAIALFLSLVGLDSDLWSESVFNTYALTWYLHLIAAGIIYYVTRQTGEHPLVRKGALAVVFWFVYAIPFMIVTGQTPSGDQAQIISIIYSLYTFALISYALLTRRYKTWLNGAFISSLLPLLLSLATLTDSAWRDGIWHSSFASLLCLSALTLGVAVMTRRAYLKDTGEESLDTLSRTAAIIGALYVVALVWLTTHGLFAVDGVAVVVSLFTYVVIGLVLYILGRSSGDKMVRYAGMSFLVGVVLRLLLVDVWQMDIWLRILTFVGVGCLFIATSFLESGMIRQAATKEELADNNQ